MRPYAACACSLLDHVRIVKRTRIRTYALALRELAGSACVQYRENGVSFHSVELRLRRAVVFAGSAASSVHYPTPPLYRSQENDPGR